jgi:ABC-type nickel/cobalt efflux system permease component RcnA
MLYAMSNNIVQFGLLSVLAISLGMFVLLVPVGAASIASREKILTFSGNFGKLPVIFEYLSILLIIGIGLMMIVPFI